MSKGYSLIPTQKLDKRGHYVTLCKDSNGWGLIFKVKKGIGKDIYLQNAMLNHSTNSMLRGTGVSIDLLPKLKPEI